MVDPLASRSEMSSSGDRPGHRKPLRGPDGEKAVERLTRAGILGRAVGGIERQEEAVDLAADFEGTCGIEDARPRLALQPGSRRSAGLAPTWSCEDAVEKRHPRRRYRAQLGRAGRHRRRAPSWWRCAPAPG